MYRNLTLLLLGALFVSLVSGCTSPLSGGSSMGSGVVIEDFSPDFSRVSSGEPFQLMLRIRNTGSKTARNVNVELYNVGQEFACTGGCGIINSLLPPDTESGSRGESRTCIWECTAPYGSPPGISVSYNPSVRVRYGYSSDVVRTITLASQDEIRDLQDSGRTLPVDTVSSSSSPVRMDVELNSPVRYWEGRGTISSPLSISVTNVGGGTVCYPDCGSPENMNRVVVESQNILGDMGIEECDIGIAGKPVTLWQGSGRTVRCNLVIYGLTPSFSRVKKTFRVRSEYEYSITRDTALEVAGRQDAPLV